MELVDQFPQYLVEDGKSPATIVSYVGDIRGFLRYLGVKGVEFDGALQRYQVTTYKKYLIEADYEVNTINKKMNSLVCFNHFLVQQGLMTELMVDLRKDKVKVASGSEREVEVYTEDEVDRILFYIHDPTKVSARDKLIITLLLFTGVRVSELVSIRLRDMDFLTMQLNVLGKGGKIREVPFRAEVIEAANEYMDTEGIVEGMR
jgi:integrase/recombinase XerD